MSKYYERTWSVGDVGDYMAPQSVLSFTEQLSHIHHTLHVDGLSTTHNTSKQCIDATNDGVVSYTASDINRLIIDEGYIECQHLLHERVPHIPQADRDKFARITVLPPTYTASEFDELEIYAAELRERFDTFVIIGIGGAILNPMAVTEFAKYFHNNSCCIDHCTSHQLNNTATCTSHTCCHNKHCNDSTDSQDDHHNTNTVQNALDTSDTPNIYYCNSLDPAALRELSTHVHAPRTAFIVISRSGYTSEVLILLNYWRNYLTNNNIADVGQHFIFISSISHSPIRKAAEQMRCSRYFFYPPDAGGRFATFTIVGVLPGILAGLDMRAFCSGGADVFHETFSNDTRRKCIISGGKAEVIDDVACIFSHYRDHCDVHATISYMEHSKCMLSLISQIFAESLAKDGNGILHYCGIGPQEQHALFPLFLNWSHNMLFTIITFAHDMVCSNRGAPSSNSCMDTTVLHASNICAQATINALIRKGRKVRQITVKKLCMATFGALMMRAALEVIMLGIAIGVDPYSQPAIESMRSEVFNKIFDGTDK